LPESLGIVPGEKFADNYRQLVALRGIMLHASVCAVGGMAPLRVLSALLLFRADFGLEGHGGITCGMKSGACAMA
jgi:NADH:ubiquinone oxidoreductase subunit F (NADH-binding)